ncbi:MAG: carbohydrate ABC transporter permease [Rhodobacteraceae bacterium]|nr:carbohydrate ABC transporter permease [Paracoccaceae bacterium]
MTRGIILAFVLGGLWGAINAVLIGVGITLVFGAAAEMTTFAAFFAGIAGAFAWLVSDRYAAGLYLRLALAGIAYALTICLLTYFAPLGIALANRPASGVLVLVSLAMTTVGAVAIAFRARDWTTLNRYRAEEVLIRALKGFGFVFFTAIVLLPFYAMLMTSLKKQAELLLNPLDYSINVRQGATELFSSYVELFTTFDFGRFVIVSTVVSVVTVLLTLAASIPGAYAISRLKFPGRTTLTRSILLIYMVPAIVLVIPLYAVFSQMGLRDTLLGLMLIYPATTIPVSLYMLQGYFRGIPSELEEAGMMDGCSRLKVIWKITLPLSLPAIASVSLYVFMIAWNEFLFAFMFLDSPEIFTLPRAVVSLNSSEVPRQHLMAGAVIVTIPVLVIFLWFERFLVSGLTAGSVKG